MKSFILKVARSVINYIHGIFSHPDSTVGYVTETPGPGPKRSRFTGIAKSRRAARQRKAVR